MESIVTKSNEIFKTITNKRIGILSKSIDANKRVLKLVLQLSDLGKKILNKIEYYKNAVKNGKMNDKLSKESELIKSYEDEYYRINIEYGKIQIKKIDKYNTKIATLLDEALQLCTSIEKNKLEEDYNKLKELAYTFDTVYDDADTKLNIIDEQLTSIENAAFELSKNLN